MYDDGSVNGYRYLIHDRDPLFTNKFTALLKSAGVKTVKSPARSPNLNAYAERSVRFVKSECLAKIIPLGEQHLRQAVTEYMRHYHVEHDHQGPENELIDQPRDAPAGRDADVLCNERLGGILNFYYRKAA